MLQAKHGFRDRARFASGEAHDTDPSTTRRRGNGDDSVIKIQEIE